MTDIQDFKNEYTRRFHDYFYYKLKNKEIDPETFYELMGVAESNRFAFFSAMRKGRGSATAEHIKIAMDKYGVRPDYIFGASLEEQQVNTEALSEMKEITDMIETLKQGLNALEKKILNR